MMLKSLYWLHWEKLCKMQEDTPGISVALHNDPYLLICLYAK